MMNGIGPAARRRLAIAALALAMVRAAPASAQAVERNAPAIPAPAAPVILGPNATPGQQDETPIGPALRALIMLGPTDPIQPEGPPGIDVRLVDRLDTPAGRAAFLPFLGRPMSRRLIAGIESAIARYYRRQGYPFVSLSTPPQELTGGAVQIRVVEFRTGAIKATGLGWTSTAFLTGRVRLAGGEAIDSDRLGEDLRWLNRYPFRQTQALFTPGEALGTADLDLASVEVRPWRIYGGVANSGSPSTGRGRGYLGALAGLPGDVVIAYQFTGSSDFWSGDDKPRYRSHGAALTIPTAPRQAFELLFNAIETNEAVEAFDVRLRTFDLNLGYRFALSNLARLPGDLVVGAEASRQERAVDFDGSRVQATDISVYQFYAGWADQGTDRGGRTLGSVMLHFSPGGLGSSNSAAAFGRYTQGRLTNARYAYLDGSGTRVFRLSGGWELSSSIQARIASGPLPDSQRIGLGGPSLVRGYNLDDDAFDSGAVWRNELRAPAISLDGGYQEELSPYLFVDAAYGWAEDAPGSGHPASIGAGADVRIGRTIDGGALMAYAISDAQDTRSGDVRVQARLTLSY